MRSGNPLTVFVHDQPIAVAVESVARPGHRPGPSRATRRATDADNAVLGRPDQWFDPAAFVLQPAGTFGNTGRGDFIGPNLRTLDLALYEARAAGPRSAAASSSGSRPSTS